MEPPLTPLEFMRRTRRLHPQREAVVDGNLRLSYEQFFDRCDRWSAALQRMGVRQGDRVAYIAPNVHQQLESFYAVPQIGAVLVPVNYRLTADDFAYIIDHSGATVVCATEDYLDSVDGIRDRIGGVKQFVALTGSRAGWLDYEATLATESSDVRRPDISESDLLTINYTSGTTARPKGVMITHRNAYLNTIGTLLHLRLGIGDRYLWTLPMFHANGWTFVWTVTSPFITVCDPLPEQAALTAAERATIKARTGVELITSGELRVVDTETGQEVPHDGSTIGEIVVRGNAVLKGYYRDAEATAKAIRDGWFHTGDAAVVHPDGDAEIRDRLKDVIISGGENISSIEVEGCLLHHSAVQEVAVVGLPHERWGEAPCAFIVLKPGQTATEEELREFARAKLAHFKVPQWFNFVEELPKTATGKIQKFVLRGHAPAVVRQ